MKILLTGATGFIGTEILTQCIAHNYIEHIYCLTRHTLDPKFSTHKKVTQIIHEDFSTYPDSLLEKLASYKIEGCIWTLGIPPPKMLNKEESEKTEIHFKIQAATALALSIASKLDPDLPPIRQKFPFRFVFSSAWGAEQNQFRSLWLWATSRKIKGAGEKAVFDIADNSELVKGKRCFEAIALRAGGVIAKGDDTSTLLWEATAPYIAVDRLAKTAIKIVQEGTRVEGKRTLENKECLGSDWANINSLTI